MRQWGQLKRQLLLSPALCWESVSFTGELRSAALPAHRCDLCLYPHSSVFSGIPGTTGTILNLSKEGNTTACVQHRCICMYILYLCAHIIYRCFFFPDEMFIIMQTVQPLDALSWKALALVSISAVSLSDPTSFHHAFHPPPPYIQRQTTSSPECLWTGLFTWPFIEHLMKWKTIVQNWYRPQNFGKHPIAFRARFMKIEIYIYGSALKAVLKLNLQWWTLDTVNANHVGDAVEVA